MSSVGLLSVLGGNKFTFAQSVFLILLIMGMMLLLYIWYSNVVLYKNKLYDTFNVIGYALFIQAVFDTMVIFFSDRLKLKLACALIGLLINAVVIELTRERIMEEVEAPKLLRSPENGGKISYLCYLLLFVISFVAWFMAIKFTNFKQNFAELDTYKKIQVVLNGDLTIFGEINIVHIFYIFYTLFCIVPIIMMYFKAKKTDNAALKKKVVVSLIFVLTIVLLMIIQLVAFSFIKISTVTAFAVGLTFLSMMYNTDNLVNTMKKQAVIQNELNIASNIQLDSLPKEQPAFPSHSEVSVSTYISAAKTVGGDFYDYFEIDRNHICFLVADVSGKSIPASLFMMTVKTMIKVTGKMIINTEEIFSRVNDWISKNNDEMMFATAWIGILNTDTLELQYTNAGHNLPYILRDNKEYEQLEGVHDMALGIMETINYGSTKIQLKYGDRLFLYTDGLTEAHNAADELLGDMAVKKILDEKINATSDEVISSLLDAIDEHAKDVPQFDDITMMCIDLNDPIEDINWNQAFV